MHLTRDSNKLLSPRRNSIGFSTLPFAFPNEPSHDLVERSWHSQSLSIAPDRAVNRVYLGAPTALQVLQHRALLIVRERDQVTIAAALGGCMESSKREWFYFPALVLPVCG